MALRKTIGKGMPDNRANLPSGATRFPIRRSEHIDERTGLIPNEVKPSTVQSIRQEAANGDLDRLYSLYKKMEATESRYGGLVSSLRNAISGLPIKTIAAEGTSKGEKNLAEEYEGLIQLTLSNMDTQGFIKHMVDSYVRGVQVLQLTYKTEELPFNKRVVIPDEIKPVARARLGWDDNNFSETYGELTIETENNFLGQPISEFDERRVLVVEDGEGKGFYDTMGAARRCLGWYITKVYAQHWWMQFVENYGQPIRLAQYPDGASDDVKDEIETFLKSLGRNAYGLLPENAQFELRESIQSGSSNTTVYQQIIDKANEEYAVTLLGQADTVGTKRNGSFARATVMDSIRHETLEHIATLVRKGFEELTRRIIKINYGGNFNSRLLPTVTPVISSPEDDLDKAKTLGQLQKQGVPVREEHYREEFGLEKPKQGEVVIHGNQRKQVTEEGLEPIGDPAQQEEDSDQPSQNG